MKRDFARGVFVAVLMMVAVAIVACGQTGSGAPPVPASGPAGSKKGGELVALEQMLLGTWRGGACFGTLTFKADGTFERQHYTPGDNIIAGTWSLQWDALPPTLLLTCRTSDFKKKDPTREDYAGTVEELKLTELNEAALSYHFKDSKWESRFERQAEK